MRPDDGGIDHRVSVVGIVRQDLEKILPNPAFRPAREARVGVLPAAEALGWIAPRRAGAEFPDYRFDEHPVADLAGLAGVARAAGQKVFNPGELIVPQSIALLRNLRNGGSL